MQGWIEGMQRSIDYFEAHLTENPDIRDIAARAGLSPFYYQRIFGALCGMTVGDYIRARRLESALRELSDPLLAHRSIAAIAARWCFPGQAHFTRAFHARYGMNPSAARKAHPGTAPAGLIVRADTRAAGDGPNAVCRTKIGG
jgi:AraC family transcriptional regulator